MDTDLAGAAGFFDGKGYIQVYRRPGRAGQNPCHYLEIVVVNTHEGSIKKLRRIFGFGEIFKNSRKGVWRPTYIWRARSVYAAKAPIEMSPWLEVKRKEAELAMDFAVLVEATRCRGSRRLSAEADAQREAYRQALRDARKRKH